MATLSSAGIGSGLDVAGIVQQLMAIERRPLQALQTSDKKTQDQLSAYGRLQSAMTTLQDAARRLTDATTWRATTVTSASTTAVTATSTGNTPAGSYAVNVTRLASAQTLSSAGFTGPDEPLGPGSLTIEMGTWGAGQTTFTPDAERSAFTLRFDPPRDSLQDVASAINAAGAGVNASVVTDASGTRLAIRSTVTGEANGFRITVTDDDGDNGDVAGLSRLAFDPSSGITRLTQGLAAANATATVNGIPVSSATNDFTNVMDGMSFKMLATTTQPVEVTVNRDTASMKKNITDFATAYNDLVKLMREQTRTPEAGAAGGVLQGDASAVGVLRQLRTLAGGSSGAATAFSRLSDIGLEPQRDGTLKVNDSKIESALGNLPELQNFFARNEEGTASDGFGQLFRAFATDRLDTDGTLTARQRALRERIDANGDRREVLEQRLALVEKRLTEQYSRLDTSAARFSSLQNYVSQQITNWNKSTP